MLLSRVSLPLNYLAGGGEIAKLPKLEISDQLVSAANVQWPVSSLSFQCIMSCVLCPMFCVQSPPNVQWRHISGL